MSDMAPLLNLLQAVLVPTVGYGIKLLWDIREHLAMLNGRVQKCEELRQAHEVSDKEKHVSCEDRVAVIEQVFMQRRRLDDVA